MYWDCSSDLLYSAWAKSVPTYKNCGGPDNSTCLFLRYPQSISSASKNGPMTKSEQFWHSEYHWRKKFKHNNFNILILSLETHEYWQLRVLAAAVYYVIGTQDFNIVLDCCFFWILEKQEDGLFDRNYFKNEMTIWNWVKTSEFHCLRTLIFTGQ